MADARDDSLVPTGRKDGRPPGPAIPSYRCHPRRCRRIGGFCGASQHFPSRHVSVRFRRATGRSDSARTTHAAELPHRPHTWPVGDVHVIPVSLPAPSSPMITRPAECSHRTLHSVAHAMVSEVGLPARDSSPDDPLHDRPVLGVQTTQCRPIAAGAPEGDGRRSQTSRRTTYWCRTECADPVPDEDPLTSIQEPRSVMSMPTLHALRAGRRPTVPAGAPVGAVPAQHPDLKIDDAHGPAEEHLLGALDRRVLVIAVQELP